MKNNFYKKTLQLFILLGISSLCAQNATISTSSQVSKYDYNEAFAPFFYTKNGTNTRSASGQPGFEYWQNRADYKLVVILDEVKNEISGSGTITYTNNSPDNMSFLWMYLDRSAPIVPTKLLIY